MPNSINILSTKTLLQNQKQLFLDKKFCFAEKDFIQIKTKDFEAKLINDNLIFSSQNTVESVLKYPELIPELQKKNAFCVGLKTKALLEKNGFKVLVYKEYGADLAEIITSIYCAESFTFFCGNIRRDKLPNMLIKNNITFNEIVVYETILKPYKIEQKIDALLFFSPSAVNSYLESNKITNEICFCIGTTTAKALENRTKNIVIASQPTVENVINEVIHYYKRL